MDANIDPAPARLRERKTFTIGGQRMDMRGEHPSPAVGPHLVEAASRVDERGSVSPPVDERNGVSVYAGRPSIGVAEYDRVAGGRIERVGAG